MNEIRKEIEAKIKELQRKSEVKSMLMIDWLKWLLAKLPEEKKEEVVVKDVKVEIPEAPKKKITFNKKK